MTEPGQLSSAIHLPNGFSFAAVTAGIKVSGRLDLAMAKAAPGTTAAALFTKNRVVAAPVEIGRQCLAKTRGRVRAVLVNSGNANCATGNAGTLTCQQISRTAAHLLGTQAAEIFPSSTGIIGVPLPAEKITAKLPELAALLEPTTRGAEQFAQAILTTDTRSKMASSQFGAGQSIVSLLGIAKGSGMIHPQMATMLVYLFTDIAASAPELKQLLREACDPTFNCMSVDGDTSTNDTVLLLASGQSGVRLRRGSVRKQFAAALLAVCRSLAGQIVADGEGVRHVIHLSVEAARHRAEALQVARAIAHSLLVKTAWAGADPNWGRILAAVGACGVPIDPRRISIYIGEQMVCRAGARCVFDEARAHQDLRRLQCDVRVLLGRGRASAVFTTTDLTQEYVKINADYST
jgi:glutamate N-acetyltransferase/amino-acid N-acetyltransferase